MPYGIPWTSAPRYRCAQCHEVHTVEEYKPYCGLCGAKQPERERLDELGLRVPGETEGKRSTDDIDEIRAFLALHHGKPIRIWMYSVSHCELELRLCHLGGACQSGEPWLNTVIYCGDTRFIQLPTSQWSSAVEVGIEPDDYGEMFVLTDRAAGVRIACRLIHLYFDVQPGL